MKMENMFVKIVELNLQQVHRENDIKPEDARLLKIMRKLSKGKGMRTKLTQADFKHLMSKKMQGAGFRDWLASLKRKAKNTVQDVKNMVSRDAKTRNQAWAKAVMKSTNFALKKALPTSKIPGLNKLAQMGIDKATKKIADIFTYNIFVFSNSCLYSWLKFLSFLRITFNGAIL